MNQNFTHITVLLDRSASMASVAGQTIEGFNKFLSDHQAAPGRCTMTLIQFDHLYEIHCAELPVASVAPLSPTNFSPRGSTALLAAMGRAIGDTGATLNRMPPGQRPGKVIFVVITDGLENGSHTVFWSRVKDEDAVNAAVKLQTDKYGWQFVYLGANQDAILEAGRLGIAPGNAMDYSTDAHSTSAAYHALAENTMRFRGTADGGCIAWSNEQRAKQEEARKQS